MFFFPLEFLIAIAKSCQINWRIENIKARGPVCFKLRKYLTKTRLQDGNSVITEVKALRNIYTTVLTFTF